MPELPEVETIVNELNENVIGEEFENIWTDKEKIIRNLSFENFKKNIKSKVINKVERKGKYIIFNLTEDFYLLIHLKMTGHLLLGKWKIKDDKVLSEKKGAMTEDSYNSYVHLIFNFKSKKQLAFSDLRQFGRVELYTKTEFLNLKTINKLGIDPTSLNFDFKYFEKLLKDKSKNIKIFLMDQEEIAGIGNIYASEILFFSKINPQRKTDSLTKKEKENLFNAIKTILKKAIKLKGDSMSDYRRLNGEKGGYQNCSLVYGRKGEKCLNCDNKIEYIKIGQRGTYFCSKCQKL